VSRDLEKRLSRRRELRPVAPRDNRGDFKGTYKPTILRFAQMTLRFPGKYLATSFE
jgi:hypothetical protein